MTASTTVEDPVSKQDASRPIVPVARPQVDEEEVQAVREVLLSGAYSSGARVAEFEKAFAAYVGTGHAVAVSTGTAALHIALEAMGVGAGDEVIVPPMTFFATVSSVLYVGARPVFADLDPDDLCLSPEDTARRIGPRTKAILPVHLFGEAARMDDLSAIASEHGLLLLEDCAQAHGTEYAGKRVGGIGDAGAFSFFATKHMTTGEGGIITTNSEAIASKARIIRSHGLVNRDDHVLLGYNNRMTEIAAAMGLVQLAKLDSLNRRRIAYSKQLISVLSELPWAVVPRSRRRTTHTYFWCPVLVDPASGRDIQDLRSHLDRHGIEYRHRYSEPLYRQPVLATLGIDCSGLSLPVAERTAGRVIGLPNHPGLTAAEVDRVVDALRAF